MDYRSPTGRLTEVRRLTKEEIELRTKDMEEHGDVFCLKCGFQGFSERAGKAPAFIYKGTFKYNKETRLFDIPNPGEGACVYECPQCHCVDNSPHNRFDGIIHLVGWYPKKGEWYPVVCENESCADKGKTYIALGCPGCGQLMYWHHASNHIANHHAWSVDISTDGLVLTMSPSLFENPPTGCHFFIRNNQIQWC